MTPEEYRSRKRIIELQKSVELRNLSIKYIEENAKYKPGDIITDDCSIIRINKLCSLSKTDDVPDIVYYGEKLKKDLTPYEKREFCYIYERYAKQIKNYDDTTRDKK